MPHRSLMSRLLGAGAVSALVALLLWPLAFGSELLLWPFVGLLLLAGLCGGGILLLTAADLLLHPRRGERVGPIRVFDVAVGAALLLLAVFQLHSVAGRLPA